jgi:hypothetical protein
MELFIMISNVEDKKKKLYRDIKVFLVDIHHVCKTGRGLK